MSKHTPGPWTVLLHDSLAEAHEERDFLWADEWDEGENGKPSTVWRGTGASHTGLPGSVEVGEANARLIAAAPAYALAWSLVPEEIKGRILDALHKPDTEWVGAAIEAAEKGDRP